MREAMCLLWYLIVPVALIEVDAGPFQVGCNGGERLVDKVRAQGLMLCFGSMSQLLASTLLAATPAHLNTFHYPPNDCTWSTDWPQVMPARAIRCRNEKQDR